jgi:microcystin-dependent protein
MYCQNCFNGCTEITSDKCVRYTGEDISELGISKGDSLLSVEEKIIQYLIKTLDGSGIYPIISSSDVCTIIESNIPGTSPFTLNEYITGLVKSLCEIDNKITVLENENPNTEYTLECLTVSDNTNTHAVLQAVIKKLCAVDTELTSFISLVDSTYVKIADINTYIANYLSSQPSQTLISNKMAPYAVVGYTGPLSNFDSSGAGIGDWDKVYLCNGGNGTPDLRGRVLVGATSGMGGGSMSSDVDPAVSGNPNYTLNSNFGINQVGLTVGQIPSHTHLATVTNNVNDPGHTHTANADAGSTDAPNGPNFRRENGNTGTLSTNSSTTGITVDTIVQNSNTGGNEPHLNYQPGTGIYYIVYIP